MNGNGTQNTLNDKKKMTETFSTYLAQIQSTTKLY